MSEPDARALRVLQGLVWRPDRMLLHDLVFRLEHFRTDAWELGDQCFVFYKTPALVDQYIRLWQNRPNFTPANVVELGVWDGGSLAFWFEVFQPAKLVGIDIQQKQSSRYLNWYLAQRRLTDRLKIHWATDQSDTARLRAIMAAEFTAPLDLVIDDASHLYRPTRASFEVLFPLLRPGGLYIIEDWAWGHWRQFRQPDHPWYQERPLTSLINDLVAAVGSWELGEGAPAPVISSIWTYQGFVVIERGDLPLDPSRAFALSDYIFPPDAPDAPAPSALPTAAQEVGNTSGAEHSAQTDPRLIAFYLPQYHPIPENNAVWGAGFTEWTNVTRATPLFPGHAQPHLPADLGFYDLRLPETRVAQAELARQYGIGGFCYYHYWFHGRQLLERPFDEVLASQQPDFPFCLCWANENWTRSWDGLEQNVLIEQHYSPEDDREHIRWLARAFRDSRYIRVQGRPLFLVYRISKLPDPSGTARIWREEAKQLGLGELYLCSVESLRDDRVDPRLIGFDAAVEFQPDWLNMGELLQELPAHNVVYDYTALSARAQQKPAVPYRRWPGVATGWDNTARRRHDVTLFTNSTPQHYQAWLEQALARAAAVAGPGEAPLVFINAWNEWGEAAYLEPSQQWGRAYLDATQRALQAMAVPPAAQPALARPAAAAVPRVSVCIPTYNGARFVGQAIHSVLGQTFTDFELLVIDDASSDDTAQVVAAIPDARLRYIQNPRRIGMVANWNRCLTLPRGEYVCVFHQDDLMQPDNLQQKVRLLDEHAKVGMVYSTVSQMGPAEEFISDWWYFKPDPSEQGVQTGAEFYKRLLSGVNIVCAPSVVARRACFDRLGGFDPRLPFTADWEMWLRIALFYDVGYLTAALVRYRRHENNETLNYADDKDLEQRFRAKALALQKFPERVPDATALRAKIGRNFAEEAVELAGQCYRRGDAAAAQRCLAVAVEARELMTGTAAVKAQTTWFLAVVDQILRQPPAAPAQPTAAATPTVSIGPAAPQPESPAGLSRQPARYQPLFRQIIDQLSGRDIADTIPLRKIIQALAFKLAAQPGFRWLSRFKKVGKRLLVK